jgi:hypothetical protein
VEKNRMLFGEGRVLAERALEQDRVDRVAGFPPAAAHLRVSREALGLNPQHLAARFGRHGHLCPDLELYDDELFTCISVRDLLRLAAVVETSVAALLFGGNPPVPIRHVTFSEIAALIRDRLAATGVTAEQCGELVGWDVQPVLHNPEALGDFNVQGLRDVCVALGIDWVAPLSEHH